MITRSGIAVEPLSNRRARIRYQKILRFAARHLLSLWWFEIVLPRLGLSSTSSRTRTKRLRLLARRFKKLALELNGLLIKLGQFMSTRLDLLPSEITQELEGLQDDVPAVDFTHLQSFAEKELGVTFSQIFDSVEQAPLAAASLGQVHRAKLSQQETEIAGFRDAIIKIQRPGIDSVIDVDLRALNRVALWLSKIRLINRRADTPALMNEFSTTCLEEIDYFNEAANAERFAKSFRENPRVKVPKIAWERTTRRVLIQEDVASIKITDTDSLDKAGLDKEEIAYEFASIMFDQIFMHGFFHADPHPGNVFVEPLSDSDNITWRFNFIDFGMMGEVPASLGKALRTTVIAAASRDGAGMVEGMREIGVLLPDADTLELERALTKAFARFGGVSFVELQEIDPKEFLAFANEFSEIVRSLPFQFPENFLLLIRAISLTSGVSSAIDRSFNFWNAIEPYSSKLIKAEGGNIGQAFLRDGLSSLTLLLRLPRRIDTLITRAETGQLSIRNQELEKRTTALNRSVRRVLSAILFGVFFISGIILWDKNEALSLWLVIISFFPLLHALFAEIIAKRGPLP